MGRALLLRLPSRLSVYESRGCSHLFSLLCVLWMLFRLALIQTTNSAALRSSPHTPLLHPGPPIFFVTYVWIIHVHKKQKQKRFFQRLQSFFSPLTKVGSDLVVSFITESFRLTSLSIKTFVKYDRAAIVSPGPQPYEPSVKVTIYGVRGFVHLAKKAIASQNGVRVFSREPS